MIPTKHPLCNDVLRKPEGMTEEECRDLHIMRGDNAFMLGDGPSVNSFWTPNAEELAAINAGAPIVLHICGHTHPLLSLLVLEPDVPLAVEAKDTPTAPAAEPPYRELFDRLMTVTKKLASMANRHLPKLRETGVVTDEFLDIISDARKAETSAQPKP